jgi:hypothetical protein
MRIIFILLFTTQISCASSFWTSMGGSIVGGVIKDQIVEVIKDKEKENQDGTKLE